MGKTIEVTQEVSNPTQAAVSETVNEVVVKLHQPIKNKQTEITQLTLRRPVAADFFGVSMLGVLQSEPEACLKVVARISFPPLTELQCRNLHFRDTWELVSRLNVFF
jgi:hypothetical protein